MRAIMVGPPCSATGNSASIAAFHGSASCSTLGSSVMYCVAERDQLAPAGQFYRIEEA
jgi:hypothetical protein